MTGGGIPFLLLNNFIFQYQMRTGKGEREPSKVPVAQDVGSGASPHLPHTPHPALCRGSFTLRLNPETPPAPTRFCGLSDLSHRHRGLPNTGKPDGAPNNIHTDHLPRSPDSTPVPGTGDPMLSEQVWPGNALSSQQLCHIPRVRWEDRTLVMGRGSGSFFGSSLAL